MTSTQRLYWANDIKGLSASSVFDRISLDFKDPAAVAQMTRAIDACKSFVDQIVEDSARGRALVLWGPTGAGKSHLLSAISFALSKTEVDQYHRSISVLEFNNDLNLYIDFVKACYTARERGKIANVDQYLKDLIAEHDLIMLDDLGAEDVKRDEWAQDQYRRLIEQCYTRRALVIASNLNPTQIKETIGARAYSRLIEMTRGRDGWLSLSKIPDRRLIKGDLHNDQYHS